jgi:N utilization substance protein B
MTRREARVTAFQLIYERSVQKDKSTSKIIKDTSEAQEFIPNKYIKAVLRGTEEKLDELDGLINECSLEWRIERMSAVSLSILRLAVYEMLYLAEEVPFRVAINEAVELAKQFDDDNAPAFINGILNKIAVLKGLKPEGKPLSAPAEKTDASGTTGESDGSAE